MPESLTITLSWPHKYLWPNRERPGEWFFFGARARDGNHFGGDEVTMEEKAYRWHEAWKEAQRLKAIRNNALKQVSIGEEGYGYHPKCWKAKYTYADWCDDCKRLHQLHLDYHAAKAIASGRLRSLRVSLDNMTQMPVTAP